jgi:hypothetical protein
VGGIGGALVVVAFLIAGGFAVLALFRWRERSRVRRVKKWVSAFLIVRYGALPKRLSINCFEDFLCPVVVRFDHPTSGARHRVQFSCPGSVATFKYLSEREESR